MRTTSNRLTALIAMSFLCIEANASAQESKLAPPAVIKVTDAKGTVALSEKNGWRNVPAFLKGASVHNRPGKPTIPARDIEFTVEKSGVVVVVTSWAYDGNNSGGWYESRSTHKSLQQDGWIPLGTMTLKRGKKEEPYSIFRRVFKSGEKVRFHTRKYNPALALSFDDELAALVMAQQAIVESSNNIGAIKVPAGPPPGSASNVLDVVMLNTHDPDKKKRYQKRGMLLREIVRQAFLIAARDELGKATRDRSLREDFPADPKPLNLPFDIMTSVGTDHRVAVTVFRQSGNGYEILWDDEFQLPKTALIENLAAKVEALSRNEFRDVLKRAGFDGKPNSFRSTAAVSAEIEEHLRQWNFLVQYTALRQLHAEVRKNGESPELLAALARGYANLGSLTAFHWSPAHKAFKARAIVYAERLVSKTKSSPWSLWHRAYVRALIGLHEPALNDIQVAKKVGAGSDVLNREPVWSEVLEAFCQFDSKKLAVAAEKGPSRSLARYLWMLAVERSSSSNVLLQAAAGVMEDNSDCFRAVDLTCAVASLGTKRAGSQEGMRFFAATLYDRLSAVTGLPKPIQKLVDDQQQGESEYLDEIELRVKLIEALRGSKSNQKDRSEPSLAVLGRLIHEVSYVHVWRLLEYQRRWLSVNADGTLEDFRPLVVGHPYGSYLDSFAWDQRQKKPALQKIMESVDYSELDMAAFPMFSDIYGTLGQLAYQQLVNPAYFHNDEVCRDLLNSMTRARDSHARLAILKPLRSVCPHLPMTVAWTIFLDWKSEKSHGLEWEEKYADSPEVLNALSNQYIAAKQTEDAVRTLSRQLEIAPDKRTYTTLANLYKGQGELEKWQETLEQYLQTPSLGLGHAQVRVTLARHFMEKKEWDIAQPYAQAAARSGAGWAMLCAADCYEGLQDWKTAERYVSSTSQRYRESSLKWFYWCQRTGQGDGQAAQEFALKYLESLEPPLPRIQLEQIAVYYILTGELDKAFEVFQASYQQSQHPYGAVHAALLADELKKTEIRDELYKTVAEVAIKSKNASPNSRVIALLAAEFQKCLAAGKEGTLDLKAIKKIAKTAPRGEPTNMYYFVGRFLDLRQEKKSAEKFLLLSATSPETIKYNCVLANSLLRNREVQAGERRGTELEK